MSSSIQHSHLHNGGSHTAGDPRILGDLARHSTTARPVLISSTGLGGEPRQAGHPVDCQIVERRATSKMVATLASSRTTGRLLNQLRRRMRLTM